MIHFFNLSISNLSTSDFKLTKSLLLSKSDVSTPVAVFKSAFVAQLHKSNSTFTFAPKDFGFGKHSLIYIMSFFIYPAIKRIIVSFPFNI